jgi:hypothetical protein
MKAFLEKEFRSGDFLAKFLTMSIRIKDIFLKFGPLFAELSDYLKLYLGIPKTWKNTIFTLTQK